MVCCLLCFLFKGSCIGAVVFWGDGLFAQMTKPIWSLHISPQKMATTCRILLLKGTFPWTLLSQLVSTIVIMTTGINLLRPFFVVNEGPQDHGRPDPEPEVDQKTLLGKTTLATRRVHRVTWRVQSESAESELTSLSCRRVALDQSPRVAGQKEVFACFCHLPGRGEMRGEWEVLSQNSELI